MRTLLSVSVPLLLSAILVTACGGSTSADDGAATPAPGAPTAGTPAPGTPSAGTPSTGTPSTGAPGSAAPDSDLASFAAAWTSFTMLESVQPLQLVAGASAACPGGGSLAYDPASGKQTLQQCRLNQFPGRAFSGDLRVTGLSATSDRSHVSASIDAAGITVAGADGGVEYTLAAGDIGSEVDDSDAGNRYFYAAHSLSFIAGTSHRYDIGNAGSTSAAILYEGGTPVRYTNNLVFTTTDGTQSWQVSASSPVREAGADRPDRGSLTIARLGAGAVLNVTFGAGNTLTLSGGEGGTTRTLSWSDAALQAALAASR